MSEISGKRVIRPSTKMVIAEYAMVAAVLAVAAWAVYSLSMQEPQPWHLVGLALFLFPIKRHIQTRLMSLVLEGDRLTMETGFLARSRRTFDLAKVQDVTAKQSVGQRLLGTGDLTLETAGEGSAMTMRGIDNPRGVADLILERSHQAVQHRSQGPV